MIRINGEHIVPGPRERVYALLQDPAFLSQAIPGVKNLRRVDENTFEAELTLGVGPIRGTFKGQVRLADQNPPESFSLHLEGRGSAGFVKGVGRIQLEEVPEGTRLVYEGESEAGGRIAQVGQRLIQSVARKMIGDGLKKLDEAVQSA